jgi:predicted amidohydrolase
MFLTFYLMEGLISGQRNVSAQVVPVNEVRIPSGTYPRAQWVKIAVLQWEQGGGAPLTTDPARVNQWKTQNRQSLERSIRTAARAGAEFVVTPELGVVGYPDLPDVPDEEDDWQSVEQIMPFSELAQGSTAIFFSNLARELGIYIQYGYVERTARDGLRNSVGVVDPLGALIANYSKMNLFHEESNYLERGDRIVTFNGPFGKAGIVICSDVYSRNTMRSYERQNLDLLLISSSWAEWNTGMDHFRTAARWLGSYVAASNQTYFPDSGVISPNGSIQSHIRQSSGLAYGYVPRRVSTFLDPSPE